MCKSFNSSLFILGSGSGGGSSGNVNVVPGGISATTKSSIYNRNKMLVALLSRQPLQSPSVPTSVAQPKVSQLPQVSDDMIFSPKLL